MEYNLERRALRASEASDWLNRRLNPARPFTARTLWKLSRQRSIPTLVVGGRYYYLTDALERWIVAGGGTVAEVGR